MRKDLMKLTAVELGKKIKRQRSDCRRGNEGVSGAIKKMEEITTAIVTVDEEGALAQAEAVQKKIDSRRADRTAWQVFRLPSRITCAPKACLPPVLQKSFVILFLPSARGS